MKKQFLEAYETEIKEQETQNRLHTKHGIQDANVVVVEKSNMIKFSVRTLGNLIRITATIMLLAFAVAGVLCLVYPQTREPFIDLIKSLSEQFMAFVK